jgi:hypothetical protein
MIELLPESSGNVLGFRFSGMVTSQDFDEVLIPVLQEAVDTYGIIRVVIEITDFKGEDIEALREDFAIDRRILNIEREAIVGDVDWDKWTAITQDFFFSFPNTDLRFFNHDGRMQAWNWIRAGVMEDEE